MAKSKHNYQEVCHNLGYQYVREYGAYVELISDYGTLHKMTKSALIKGAKAKLISVVGDKKEYFIKDVQKKHPKILDEISFDGFKYESSLTEVFVECLKHGKYKTKPSYIMQGGNMCKACDNENKSNRNKITTSEFIKRCISRHGDTYSYDKTIYTGFKNKVTVICKEHGDFEIVAYYHASESGCQECGQDKMGISKDKYDEICPDGSYVYIMSFKGIGEDFLKIGISKDLRIRVNGLRSISSYDVELLYSEFFIKASDAWEVERLVMKEFSQGKYTPNNRFSSDTECFYLSIKDEVIKLLKCVA